MSKIYIHPTAEVNTTEIGMGTKISQLSVVLGSSKIGSDVKIGAQCFIENEVKIGNRVTIMSGVYIRSGIEIFDDVYIGSNVTFVDETQNHFGNITVKDNADIGAGATIYAGITIGQNVVVEPGSVVTKSIPANAIVSGVPARICGYIHQETFTAFEYNNTLVKDKVNNIGVGGVTLHQMKVASDLRGSLSVGEFNQDIPFDVKRYFLVYDVPSYETRGEHAHKECHQFLICVRGKCSVVVDNGHKRSEVQLDKPQLGLYLPPMTWGIQYKYSDDAVLLVFASHPYDSGDYIRDYDEFQDNIRNSI